MAPITAARLARSLLQLHVDSVNFFFEVDTAENALMLAEELKALGCAVLFDSSDFRLNVYLPLQKEDGKKHGVAGPKAVGHSLIRNSLLTI